MLRPHTDAAPGDRRPFAQRLVLPGCIGKQRFTSPGLAHQVAQRMIRRRHIGIRSYRCRFCGAWHLGTPEDRLVPPRRT
ncbi:MAG: hypothetical protein E6J14_14360 [Chloroflexi bacterium]|nr:MAG: hypothetical protein E6J14_14360 [Chloroflexota bacterium]